MLIISHELFLRTGDHETVIAIKIYKPEKQETVWACRY